MEHSNYSPSRLSRIMKCPGSVELINNLMSTKTIKEEGPSSYAAHGTSLHKVIEDYYQPNPGHHNDTALEGLELDDRALVQDAADYVDLVLKSKGHHNCLIGSELSVSLESWGVPDVWGTLDYKILDPFKRHVDIIDWKFGSGVTVYAKENPQMLAYGAGAVKWPTTVQNLTLHVVQPAIDHYDSWSLTINNLYDWVHGDLAIALNKCHTPGIEVYNPSIEACRWCEAKNYCNARDEFVQETAIQLFEAKEKLAFCPSLESLVELLKKVPLVEDAIKSIRLYLQTELTRGNPVPGMKLIRGRANRKWVDDNVAITWIAKNTSIEELFTSKLRSPSQFEKEVRKLKKSEGFKKLWEKPEGKISMVPESDGRPAIQTESGAIDVFSNISDK